MPLSVHDDVGSVALATGPVEAVPTVLLRFNLKTSDFQERQKYGSAGSENAIKYTVYNFSVIRP